MIAQGDGSWQLKLSKQRCPRCYSLMAYKGEDLTKTRHECLVCKLKVVDVKGDESETS